MLQKICFGVVAKRLASDIISTPSAACPANERQSTRLQVFGKSSDKQLAGGLTVETRLVRIDFFAPDARVLVNERGASSRGLYGL